MTGLESVAIANALQLKGRPTSHQSLSALITTRPYQILSGSAYPLLSHCVFTVDTLRYAVILTFDPLTLNVCCRLDVTRCDSVPNLSEIKQSATESISIS